MPLIVGPIAPAGPLVDALVGIDPLARRFLGRQARPEPHPVPVRVLVDTGSSLTAFAPSVFARRGLAPTGTVKIFTRSTRPDAPHACNQFLITLFLIANGTAPPFSELNAIAADGWLPGEGVEGLIGRDVLDHCGFQYWGPDQRFQLSF